MSKLLVDFEFTTKSDIAISENGWTANVADEVYASSGDDQIIGYGAYNGLANNGLIDTGNGDDIIDGTSNNQGLGASGVFNSGVIRMGAGNDRLTCGGFFALTNLGQILLESGDDEIIVDKDPYLVYSAINNETDGLIDTGLGSDSIIGIASSYGIFNAGVVRLGSGADLVLGEARIDRPGTVGLTNWKMLDSGDGNDSIIGVAGIGISNSGVIDAGSGDDVITGQGIDAGGAGIYNKGLITTAKGDDIVKAIGGYNGQSIAGGGKIDLGDGKDVFHGFGSGTVVGGSGVDQLSLPTGTYGIQETGQGSFLIGGVMRVEEFELFGPGADQESLLAAASVGTITFA
jgi:hypothetical protein